MIYIPIKLSNIVTSSQTATFKCRAERHGKEDWVEARISGPIFEVNLAQGVNIIMKVCYSNRY